VSFLAGGFSAQGLPQLSYRLALAPKSKPENGRATMALCGFDGDDHDINKKPALPQGGQIIATMIAMMNSMPTPKSTSSIL